MSGLYEQIESHLAKKQEKDPTKLYARLNQELDDQTTGITTVDLMGLTGTQKKIMLMMIRDNDAITEGLMLDDIQAKLETVPDDLDETLKILTQNGWLILLGEAPRVRFRVFMKRKRSSTLGFGIWSAITKRLEQQNN